MRVYRQTTTKDGELITVKKWYGDVHLPGGRRCRLPLFESESLSRDFAAKLETMISQYDTGVSYDKNIQLWIAQLSPSMIKRFAKMGLVSSERAAGTTALEGHINDWKAALLNKGNRARAGRFEPSEG